MQDPTVKMALRTYSKQGLWAVIGPGGFLHPSQFIDWGGHLMVEGFLVMLCMYMLMLRAHKLDESELVLKDREVEDLVKEWEPAPLVKKGAPIMSAPPRVEAVLGAHTVVAGRKCVNCASMNFLGIQGDADITAKCEQAMDKYGVGSCGPRGFYGTFDVHLGLEERMANFMGVEDATLYAYDAATVSSVIPCFSKKGDRIVADSSVNFGIQTGILLSRSDVAYFEHNNAVDLRRILEEFRTKDGKRELTRPTFRKFLAIEGVYANSGDVAPLREIFDLAKEFKYRIIMDESFSLGVLGRRGRGLSEEVGLEPQDIDIIVASLGNSLGSAGGICLGSKAICYHLRLNSSGYVFSASLPPFLAVAAQAAIDKLDDEPERVAKIGSNARAMRRELGSIRGVTVLGNSDRSPLIHLKIHAFKAGTDFLQRAVDAAVQEGVLVDIAEYCALERSRPSATIRVTVSAGHSAKDVRKAAARLKAALKRTISEVSLIDASPL